MLHHLAFAPLVLSILHLCHQEIDAIPQEVKAVVLAVHQSSWLMTTGLPILDWLTSSTGVAIVTLYALCTAFANCSGLPKVEGT